MIETLKAKILRKKLSKLYQLKERGILIDFL